MNAQAVHFPSFGREALELVPSIRIRDGAYRGDPDLDVPPDTGARTSLHDQVLPHRRVRQG